MLVQHTIEHYYAATTVAFVSLVLGFWLTNAAAARLDAIMSNAKQVAPGVEVLSPTTLGKSIILICWSIASGVYIVSVLSQFFFHYWTMATAGSDLHIGLIFFDIGLPLGVLGYYFAAALIGGIVKSIQSKNAS